MRTANHLANETSPYLLQHAYNPVAWYPWGDFAFDKAKNEDKPIFLSIGYSTCHWCHVMENESFEDDEIAEFLNANFVSVKVDREQRPDIDSVYMSVCTALTGSGGWPLTVIMTPDGKPFFAGTYFQKTSKYGRMGLLELLQNIVDLWLNRRGDIDKSAQDIVAAVSPVQRTEKAEKYGNAKTKTGKTENTDGFSGGAVEKTYKFLSSGFDDIYGGFGAAPKFPAAHNLLFLLEYYNTNKDENALLMAEKTLISMYKGGIFDHIGYGFCRYSTDKFWLVPHFEKMLYDNALLLSAYTKAYTVTKKEIYKAVADRIIEYIQREMTDIGGGFCSAQDADVSGEEGKYYALSLSEIIDVLGKKDGNDFSTRYGITEKGNFDGKNIPNLIENDDIDVGADDQDSIIKLYKYRKNRFKLETDDKILTSWNCLMIAALADASVAFGKPEYLVTAKKVFDFIDKNMKSGDKLFASYRAGKHSGQGFLDDYAFYVYACICLHNAELDDKYIKSALKTTEKIIEDFSAEGGGFYLSSDEELIFRPVEVYDGAMPCGNSVMCYNLVYLSAFTGDKKLYDLCSSQIDFMLSKTSFFSGGASFFALSQLKSDNLSKVVCVPASERDLIEITGLTDRLRQFDIVKILSKPSADYPLKDNKTTFYLCRGNTCFPPQNELSMLKLS